MRTKRINTYDLLVLKISKNGFISSSRCCFNCIKQLEEAKYVKIKNVFYSNSQREIIHETFEELVDSIYKNNNVSVSSGYRYRMGCYNKKFIVVIIKGKCKLQAVDVETTTKNKR